LSGGRQVIVFAVNTYNRWSKRFHERVDIFVDVDGDGFDDYLIVGADDGAVRTGSFSGLMGSFVFSRRSGIGTSAGLALAPRIARRRCCRCFHRSFA